MGTNGWLHRNGDDENEDSDEEVRVNPGDDDDDEDEYNPDRYAYTTSENTTQYQFVANALQTIESSRKNDALPQSGDVMFGNKMKQPLHEKLEIGLFFSPKFNLIFFFCLPGVSFSTSPITTSSILPPFNNATAALKQPQP